MLQFFRNLLSASFETSSEQEPKSTNEAQEPVEIDLEFGTPLGDEVDELRQAQVVSAEYLVIDWPQGERVTCPRGVAVVSQTCDAVRGQRAEIQVSPVVELNTSEASAARSGRVPRYAHLPLIDDRTFADLTIVGTCHKAKLLGLDRRSGVDEDDILQVGKFARSVSRRFDRFAFPEEVVSWLRPLQTELRSKSPRERSPMHEPLRRIAELRLEAVGGWKPEPPFDLVLLVIVKPGYLPDPDALSGSLTAPEEGESPTEVADSMPGLGSSPDEIQGFWDRFGTSLVHHCRQSKDISEGHRLAVRSFTAEAVSEDYIVYSRVRRSAEIDLDHLSDPAPR